MRHDNNACLIEHEDNLYQSIGKLSLLLAHSEALFITGNIIAGESRGKPRHFRIDYRR